MLNNIKKRNSDQKGFTIIEVLIVLAIAGLILLIVFLAVPALQRSSRNTQRKNDASSVGSAVANFISNNGGSLPISLGKDATANVLDVCSAGGGAAGGAAVCTAATNLETAKLGFYTPANITLLVSAAAPAAPTATTLVIDTGYGCNATNTGLGAVNTRTAAILYATETGGANASVQCIEQ